MGLAALLVCSSYSSSDTTYGTTGNAASTGLSWVMSNILPRQAGLTVDGVFYRYTTVKDPSDDMLVHVQNEDAQGPGYIFRSTDDWSGLPGNTLTKTVQVGGIPLERWGAGSIQVEGTGSVENASVIYNYKFDPCFDPQADPICPGYIDFNAIYEFAYSDPLDDELIQAELQRKADLDDKEQKQKESEKKESKKDERLEKVLGIVNTSLLAADAASKAAELFAMGAMPLSYYKDLPGGKYEETLTYRDKNLPDNSKGLRNGLAQQLLHQKMVNMQYIIEEKN